MSNIVELVANFKKTQAEMLAKLKQDGEEELKVVFADIFAKHPGLKAFTYAGYTPGFNDGDPCTHNGWSAVGIFEKNVERGYWTDDCNDNSEMISFLTEEGHDDIYVDDDETITSVNAGCMTLERAAHDVSELEDIIELVYDTNYVIKVSLNGDAKVVVEHDYYECGY